MVELDRTSYDKTKPIVDIPTPRYRSVNPSLRIFPEYYEGQRKDEPLTQHRIGMQVDYLDNLRAGFTVENPDNYVQTALFLLNGCTRDYMDELLDLSNAIPPKDSRSKETIIIPAYNEAEKIERMLNGWVSQVDERTGLAVDPSTFEIVILLNRPNATRPYDDTQRRIDSLKMEPRYQGFNIHVVEKTFNIPVHELQEKEEYDGREAPMAIATGTRMGLIYKLAADLAVLRNIQSLPYTDHTSVANYLLKTGGADALGRNPTYLSHVFSVFERDPEVEQYVCDSDYPQEIYEKIPLLHALQRFRDTVNLLHTSGNSHIGNGNYRAATYAEAGGFNPASRLAEEMLLSRRMRLIMNGHGAYSGREHRRKEFSYMGALDDPRRAIATLYSGARLTHSTDVAWEDSSIRNQTLEGILKGDVPSCAQLTRENLNYQLSSFFQLYFRLSDNLLGLEEQDPQITIQKAYQRVAGFTKAALADIGITEYNLVYGIHAIDADEPLETITTKLKGDIQERPRKEILPLCRIEVTGDLSQIEPALQKYMSASPDWRSLNFQGAL